MIKGLTSVFILTSICAFGQIEQIKSDLYFLASDSLKGRNPGTPEALIARDYIQNSFAEADLTPIDGQWFQEFPIPVNVDYSTEGNTLSMTLSSRSEVDGMGEIEEVILSGKAQNFPVKFSSNGKAYGQTAFVGYGITAPELEHDDYADADVKHKIAVIDVGSPDGVHPHSQYMKYHGLDYRIQNAKDHGAIGVVFVHMTDMAQPPRTTYTAMQPAGLPAWFVGDKETAKQFTEASLPVSMSTDLQPKSVTGYNVVGFLDRGMPTTLIIGAHYDHLGMGGNNSLYRGEAAIHNGADDNASGTSGLLELARHTEHLAKSHNLLFIAFSGEEKGLIGSDFYSDNPTIDLSTVVAMLNMDMIGRLSEDNEILISGTGTAEEWDEILSGEIVDDFKVSSSEGGTGASDHTSFYQKDIPVLHFFTGTHNDYHKPSDDAELINYEGLELVTELITYVANRIPEEMTFQKTADSESQSTPRFNVTLGIIPDYIFGGPGVKVDGVTEGKPAANAGLEMEDIVLKIGEYPISDIYAYMRALGAFKPGDETTVTVKRGDEELVLPLTF